MGWGKAETGTPSGCSTNHYVITNWRKDFFLWSIKSQQLHLLPKVMLRIQIKSQIKNLFEPMFASKSINLGPKCTIWPRSVATHLEYVYLKYFLHFLHKEHLFKKKSDWTCYVFRKRHYFSQILPELMGPYLIISLFMYLFENCKIFPFLFICKGKTSYKRETQGRKSLNARFNNSSILIK